jgi:hypothetical protein
VHHNPKHIPATKFFGRLALIFWYFLPLYVLALLCILAPDYMSIEMLEFIVSDWILVFFLAYFASGSIVSGVVIFKVLGDRFNWPFFSKFILSLLIIFFGGSIIGTPMGSFSGGYAAEILASGHVWTRHSFELGNLIEGVIRTALYVSGIYFAITLMWSIIPVCVIFCLSFTKPSVGNEDR